MDETRTRSFPLRIFGLGCPSEGAVVTAHIENEDFLIIQSNGGIRPIPLVKILTRLQGDKLILEWEQNKEPYYAALTLKPTSDDQKAGWGPSSWHSMMKCFPPPSSHHQIETTGWFGIFLFMLVGLAVVVFICYWVFYKDVVNITTKLLPREMEQQLADQLWQQRVSQLPLIENTTANLLVNELAKRLNTSQASSYQYRWFIANQAEIQALSLPGGYMVLNRGLIEQCQSADELAGIMAHEMAHVEARDGLREVISEGGIQLVWALTQRQLTAAQLSNANQRLNRIEFTPEQEVAADLTTLAHLQQSQISSVGWREFFDRIQRQQIRDLPPLLSDHPVTEHRLPQLQANKQDFAALPYDWPTIRASLTP